MTVRPWAKNFAVMARNMLSTKSGLFGLGIREFLFYDDTFTVNRNRVFDICSQIVKLGLDIRWDIRARVDTVDEEMLKALKQAGCVAIHYGVESGSEPVLKRLKKGIDLDSGQGSI